MSLLEMRTLIYDQKPSEGFIAISALPLIIDFKSPLSGRLIRVRREGRALVQASAQISAASLTKGFRLRPHNLREAFLKAKSDEEIEHFLSACGPFHTATLPQSISVAQFVSCQEFIASLWNEVSPASWPDFMGEEAVDKIVEPRLEPIVRKELGTPRLAIFCETALEVIGATILVDRLNRIRTAKCEWKNCGMIFALQSEHERKFCSAGHRRLKARDDKRKALAEEKRKADLETTNAKA